MKIREDFVTNSSSSSFILGKKDDDTTIESVFQIIKGFYREYLNKRDAAIKYVEDNPKLGLIYSKSKYGNYYGFDFIGDNKYDSKQIEINNMLERNFDISTLDIFEENYDWLDCKTYQDYENYWLDKIHNSNDKRVIAPFTIADFSNPNKINWIHCGDYKDTHEIDSKADVLNWYFESIQEAFENLDSCDNCRWEFCDKEQCIECKKLIKDNNIPEDRACLYLLGHICIYSECGLLPDYIVEQLTIISEYSCNHMG